MTTLPIPTRTDVATAAELLGALIDIPSINPAYDAASPGEGTLARAIGEWGRAIGCHVDFPGAVDDRPNVRARLAAPEPTFTLLIEGHTDTVGLPAGHTRPAARRDGDRMFGRGACDVKGGLAAALMALAELAGQPPRHVDVILLGAIDEEYQFRGITEYLAHGDFPDASIVLEPTELAIVNAHNGVVRVEVLVEGEAGHTSLPPPGRNAIADAGIVIDALTTWHTQWTERTSDRAGAGAGATGLLTATTIAGGSAINIVPDQCRIGFDIRVAPQDDPEELLSALERELAELRTAGVRASIGSVLLVDGGMFTDPADPLVQAALAAANQDQPAWVPYGTDGSKLARKGVPTIVLGPGSIAQAHSDDEWVDLNDVVSAAQTIARTVRLLDERAAS